MLVYEKLVYQMTDNGEYALVEEKSYEYDGPWALCDRNLQAASKKNATDAGSTAGGYGSSAATESSALNPFYTQEMKAQHGFTPGQTNELLTAAGAGAGGATGSLVGEANLDAARTRNASGFTKSLDEAARDKDKSLAANSEGVAAQDVMGAKTLNQEGAAGMQGLYGTNVNAQLKAMGQQNEDVNTSIEAGKSGWLQNMNSTLTSLGNASSLLCPAKGSKYRMADGTGKLVEYILLGDKVLGRNGDAQIVTNIHEEKNPVLRVETENGCVTRNSTTHCFVTPDEGFVIAAESLGTLVLTDSGPSRVVSVKADGFDSIFSIETDGDHTYNADGVWALGVGDKASDDAVALYLENLRTFAAAA